MSQTKHKKRGRIQRLWKSDRRCFWCKRPTVILPPDGRRKVVPDDMATIDHLNSKYSEHRGKTIGPATVLSCYRCNFERGRKETLERPIEELRRRSQRGITGGIKNGIISSVFNSVTESQMAETVCV